MPPTNLELWQTEWCPSSHRVRQRMTELGLAYTVRQVPVERADRHELISATGQRSIPVLIANGEAVAGEDAILGYLNSHCVEPLEAASQRARAAVIRTEELEQACQQLAPATRGPAPHR